MTDRATTLVIEANCLLTPPKNVRETLLRCAELDGIKIIVYYNGLTRWNYQVALSEIGLLQYIDELNLQRAASSNELWITHPSEANYQHVAKKLSRTRNRAIHRLV